jgi:L-asparaginase
MISNTYPGAQHVMVLYTGGTIGMQASSNGLAPASGFEARMREYLHSQPDLVVPQWRFREMSPLIDSANMTPTYWQQLREAVVDAVDVQGCDSVLILHGTDTLAYSAAAMSFQLLGLHARVVFTGSMLPAGVTDSDAWENLGGALVALGQGLAPGVQLYFHGELLDGLLDSGIQGLVLECYGSGTGPSDNPEFLAALARARDSGVVVVAVTQCHEGAVELDVYEAGSRLRGVGVLSGGGMTREAAFGKLHALLGAGLETQEVRRLIELDLCGELI